MSANVKPPMFQSQLLMAGDPAAGFDEQEFEDKNVNPYMEGNLHLAKRFSCPAVILVCRFSCDGSVLAVGLSDGTIRIYNPDTEACLYSCGEKGDIAVTSIRFLPNTPYTLIATYANGDVKVWHYTETEHKGPLFTDNEDGQQTLSCAINAEGTRAITGGTDGVVNVYDLNAQGKFYKIHTCEASDSREIMNGHRSRIFALQYHPIEEHVFVSGGWDDTVQFWDDRQRHAVRSIYGPHICGDALDIDAVHDHLLTGSWRKKNTLQIYDFGSGKLIKDIPNDPMHQSQLYCAQWFGKEHIICGGSNQNMARVIDRGTLNTVGQLVDLPTGVSSMDNDRGHPKPLLALASDRMIYTCMLKSDQRKS